MKTKLFLLLFTITFFAHQNMTAQDTVDKVLSDAYAQAAKENKNVLIIFTASWCGWCKKMIKKIESESLAPLINRNYVVRTLTVKESSKNKHLENPGAEELLKKYKGDRSGIPFFLIFDAKGNFLDDSFNEKEQNLGCPATKEEIAVFKKKLKATSSLTDNEITIIAKKFAEK